MAGNLKEFNDGNFEAEVLKAQQPVLVDFWAEWCVPCKLLGPTMDKLATAYGEKVKIGKVDTDANRDTAIKYRIDMIPTVILFKDGQVAQRFVGIKSEKEYKEAIDAVSPTAV